MKKRIVVLTAIMCLLLSQTVLAAGWQQNSKGWWYENPDCTYPRDEWIIIDGKWYLFDADGYMRTGWHVWNGNRICRGA